MASGEDKGFNIIIAGVGGQGVFLASTILGAAALLENLHTRIAETHGLAQRGGSIISHVKIGREVSSPLIPEAKADVLIAFEPLEALRYAYLLKRDGKIIVNTEPIKPLTAIIGQTKYPSLEAIISTLHKAFHHITTLNATKIAKKAGNPRTANIVLLGALAAAANLPFKEDSLKKAILLNVPKGTEDINLKAFKLGYDLTYLKTTAITL